MSRAGAEIYTPEGRRLGFGIYDGTSDTMGLPGVYPTWDAAWDAWWGWRDNSSRGALWGECAPACWPHVPILIYSHYGSGSYWMGTACPTCRRIREGLNPDEAQGFTRGKPPFPLLEGRE